MKRNWPESLLRCLLFQGIPHDELQLMLQCLKPRILHFCEKEWVAQAGEAFNGLGIVLAGEVALSKENPAGERALLTVIKEGGIVGEMAAFSGSNIWPASVEARIDSEVMFLPPEVIIGNCRNQCASHRLLITNMLKIISQKALMLNKKVEYLTMKSLREKIGAYLLEVYRSTGSTMFVLPLKREDLADYLDVTRPSLSRELGRMRDEGMIEYHRSAIKIVDLDALMRITA